VLSGQKGWDERGRVGFFLMVKCEVYIQGYRFIPDGESWTREDRTVFVGEMVSPWQPFSKLDATRHQYEKELLSETQEALNILLGEVEI
jgi:hypothetical protein